MIHDTDDELVLIDCDWCDRQHYDVYVSGKELLCSSCLVEKRLSREYLEKLDRLHTAPF